MGTRGKNLTMVFDGPPGPEGSNFVEVEDASGFSVEFGSWNQRADGLWTLGPIQTFDDACLSKCAPGEPIFVLRAQDSLAPHIVREWADAARMAGHISGDKYEEALACANRMEAWPNRKLPD